MSVTLHEVFFLPPDTEHLFLISNQHKRQYKILTATSYDLINRLAKLTITYLWEVSLP